MLAYAARDFGARRLEMTDAIRPWRGAIGPGRRMISGSANKL
jgi:hypothetical protein